MGMTLRRRVGYSVILLACVLGACLPTREEGSEGNTTGISAPEATDNALATAFARHQMTQNQPTATSFVVNGSEIPVTQSAPLVVPSATPTLLLPTTIEAPTDMPTAQPTPTSPEPTVVAYASIDSVVGEHYWLAHPFYPDTGYPAATSYLFGVSTPDGKLQPHHGLDFQAPHGTVVTAAGSGTVFYAGNDFEMQVFGPRANFYGNVVVIEHNIPLPDSGAIYKLYTLYGHLSVIYVEEGSPIQQFDPIGEVGMTGIAQGPHLHFEVRIGDPYSYTASHNPALWLIPRKDYGVLAGQVKDAEGNLLSEVEIRVIDPNTRATIYTSTYAADAEVSSDPWHRENFAVPQLLVGKTYEVQINRWGRQLARREITILPDETTLMLVIDQ